MGISIMTTSIIERIDAWAEKTPISLAMNMLEHVFPIKN